jgi:two-component system sensor histidine kinase/response regulator
MYARILVAEDEPDILDIVALVLAEEGHTVTRAVDGAAALAALARDRHDLLITDHMLPRLSGADLIARIRARERATRPAPRPFPIILMSAAGDVAVAPPTVFLAKPFDLGDLVALVNRLLAGS